MAMMWRILVAALVLGSLGCFSGKGFTSLHATAVMDASARAEVLLKQGANVNAKDNEGQTPLHIAAENDASATAEVLLKQGANVNARNNKGLTPLHATAVRDASAIAEVLLKQGANVNATNNEGFTPLHMRQRWMLLRQPRSCSSKVPTSTPQTTGAKRRCTLRQ